MTAIIITQTTKSPLTGATIKSINLAADDGVTSAAFFTTTECAGLDGEFLVLDEDAYAGINPDKLGKFADDACTLARAIMHEAVIAEDEHADYLTACATATGHAAVQLRRLARAAAAAWC